MLKRFAGLLVAALMINLAPAQSVIPVGAGSYASYPPTQANAGGTHNSPSSYLVAANGKLIPSNKWWTDLITHQYAGNMWAYPLTVSAEAQVKAPAKPGPYRLFVYALDGHGKAAYSNISFCVDVKTDPVTSQR